MQALSKPNTLCLHPRATVKPDNTLLFLGIFAHEIKSKIAGAVSVCNYLQLSQSDNILIEAVSATCQDTIHMMDNLLTTVKVESGHLTVTTSLQFFNLTSLVHSIIQPLQITAVPKKITISLSHPALLKNVTITTDKIKLGQILHNLLSNAVKFSYRNTDININFYLRNQHLVFEVSNECQQIGPEEISHLFTPFYQQDHGKAGSGLGLYICRLYAEALEGTIIAESSEEITVFTVTIPVIIH